MFIFLGLGLSTEITQAVFGAPSTQQVDTERIGLPVFDNAWSKRVRGIVESIQKERTRCMRVRNDESYAKFFADESKLSDCFGAPA